LGDDTAIKEEVAFPPRSRLAAVLNSKLFPLPVSPVTATKLGCKENETVPSSFCSEVVPAKNFVIISLI
jgi:hypothetical protein